MAAIPDAKIIFTKVPLIQYEQLLLDKNSDNVWKI